MRVVIDTNVLVSAIILPRGRVGILLAHIRRGTCTPLYCAETLEELIVVLARPCIRTKYHILDGDIRTVVDLLLLQGEMIEPVERVTVCRDPKDDIFLEVAMAGQADALVTGDDDLLILNPFRGIPILTPAAFLARMDSG